AKNHKRLTAMSKANEAAAPVHSDTEKPGGGMATPNVLVSSRIDVDQATAAAAQSQVTSSAVGGTLLRKVQPVYPAQAIAQHLEGSVVLQATVAADGKVQEVTVLRGDPLLARAATDAVRQWQYALFGEHVKAIQTETEISMGCEAQ